MKDGLLTDAYIYSLSDIATFLENCSPDDEEWKEELQERVNSLKDKIETYYDHGSLPVWDFSEAKATPELAADDVLRIRPMRADDVDFYTGVRVQWSAIVERTLERSELGKAFYAAEIQDDTAFFCVIERLQDAKRIGYVSLKNTRKPDWEIAIELDKDACCQGYGGRAVLLFLNAIKGLTGRSEYQACIASDNIISQKCMRKIGARLHGICCGSVLKTEAKQKRFEERNLDRIDENMRELARELNIEPRKLLSNVLDYRIVI